MPNVYKLNFYNVRNTHSKFDAFFSNLLEVMMWGQTAETCIMLFISRSIRYMNVKKMCTKINFDTIYQVGKKIASVLKCFP